MGNVSIRKETGRLYFDFRYFGQRCREQTTLEDTKENRHKMLEVMKRIDAEIALGTFDYARYFPTSPFVYKFQQRKNDNTVNISDKPLTPLFKKFAEEWYDENTIRWKRSYRFMVQSTLTQHLIPAFGETNVSSINKGDILKFRSSLAKVQNGKIEGLSPDRINHIMTPLRMILADAADRNNFTTPFTGIKPLRVPRTDVDPFSLEEVKRFLAIVRPDFKCYYTVRFLTGLRTSEIDGLKWCHVDLERRQILVRDTYVMGQEDSTKTDSSQRFIEMSQPVYDALVSQQKTTGTLSRFVFCTRDGSPLNYSNVTNRVWYPTLNLLGLKKRVPYQTRHTTATLWLGSGENPEWIARQMGHSTTKMLFTVYSRYVPNLTRKDGSAFERLVSGYNKEKTP
jgi:integrase